MTTSQANITFKRAIDSIKRFLNKSLSKLSPPETESNTPNRRVRARKPLLGLFKSSEPKEVIHVFGILGIVGPLSTLNSGWMTTDFAAWVFLITHMKGYATERSTWRTIRPISHLFPDGSVTFGEAGCDRLQLPLPSTLETGLDPAISARLFASTCLLSLQDMARKVKPGEKLVLLLIGHGGFTADQFQFLITTQTNELFGEAFITKDELEAALRPCQGDILVICNSCFSGHLASERWTLFCSAAPGLTADSLSESDSGYFRGSAFTACVVAQAAQEHGLRVPLPRAEPRLCTSADHPVSLPPSPPSHSFSTAQISVVKPSNVSFEEFVRRMLDMEQFLVANSLNVFQVRGSKSMLSWTSILPVNFTAEVVDRISVKATSAAWVTRYNEAATGEGLQGGPLPTLVSQSPRFDPLLVQLATAMPDIGQAPRTRDAIYANICADFRRHIAEPEQYASPLQANTIGEESLLLVLQSMHVQAVAVQQIARELGWCDAADKVVPFLPLKNINWDFSEMIENGIRVDELPWHLKRHHFHGLRPAMDRTSGQWLSVQWAAAGKPTILRPDWDKLVEKVGRMTEREAIR